ncbi:MAG: peptide deformylase [Paludibacter sp.]|nr:peptide deformylase [Paludibacter sp.]
MDLKIIKYGSHILREKSIEVIEKDNIALIVENLFSTLKKEGGLGLAGPQVGIQKRIFVIDTSPLAEEDLSIPKIEKAIVNPEIVGFSKENGYYTEGCLSIPGIYENVLRPKNIDVRYYDINFNLIEESLDGIKARIFQHEYDHLEGVLFIDRLSSMQRKLLSRKLNRIKNR